MYARKNHATVEINLLRSSKNLCPCARKNNAEVEIHAKAHTLWQKTSAWVLHGYVQHGVVFTPWITDILYN